MVVVALRATSVVGAVAATPVVAQAQAWSCNCVKTNVSIDGDAYPGRGIWMNFDWTNDSDRTWTNARMSVIFPEGVELEWSNWEDQSYDPATRTLTGTPSFWNDGVFSDTIHPWAENSQYFEVTFDESLVGTRVNILNVASYVSPDGTPSSNRNGLYVDVQEKAVDFDYRTETRFTPDSSDYSGTSTLTSKVYNDGPGRGGQVEAEIYFDGALTLVSDVPDGCRDYGVNWRGMRNIDCTQEVPEGGADVGLVASWSFTVTIPDAPIAADVATETYEAETGLGCSTSGVSGSEDSNDENNSDSAILTVPPSPVGRLAVVRNLPASIDKPGITTNPTAGRSMTSSVDVFNAGDAAITGPISVVIDPMPGFTPTSITATSEDSTTPVPDCDLATLTCTFSQLGDGLRARIVIVGDLAPTIVDGTEFSSSVTVSATGYDPASDTGSTTISALAEGIVSITSVTHAAPGEEVSYDVTVVNAGPSTMLSPVVTVTLPTGMTIVSLPDNCTQSGNTLTCTLGESLDPETDVSFGFTAGLPDEVGDHTITATLSSSTPLAEASATEADHLVATATTVTDLGVEESDDVLPYTGSNSTMLVLVGGGLALGGLILVSATGMLATRRRND